jgi:hypothetical protein
MHEDPEAAQESGSFLEFLGREWIETLGMFGHPEQGGRIGASPGGRIGHLGEGLGDSLGSLDQSEGLDKEFVVAHGVIPFPRIDSFRTRAGFTFSGDGRGAVSRLHSEQCAAEPLKGVERA